MSESSISLTPQGSGGSRSSTSSDQPAGSSDSQKASVPSKAPQESQNGHESESKQTVSEEKARESAELLNKSAEILNRDIRFNVLLEENVIQAEIINRENDKVVKKVPPDKIIEMRKQIDAFIGLFVDESR